MSHYQSDKKNIIRNKSPSPRKNIRKIVIDNNDFKQKKKLFLFLKQIMILLKLILLIIPEKISIEKHIGIIV